MGHEYQNYSEVKSKQKYIARNITISRNERKKHDKFFETVERSSVMDLISVDFSQQLGYWMRQSVVKSLQETHFQSNIKSNE